MNFFKVLNTKMYVRYFRTSIKLIVINVFSATYFLKNDI